ncbi:MAG: carbamoyltransferase HypF, partial [Candidatus Rokuibacteriota bacterium]
VAYEAQAAMELEALAAGVAGEPYPFRIVGEAWPLRVETRPVIAAVVDDLLAGAAPSGVAARFHVTLAEVISTVCARIRERTGLERVALSGGVFQNARLLEDAARRLAAAGFEVYTHAAVPPNDGGLALGQAAVAAATLAVEG